MICCYEDHTGYNYNTKTYIYNSYNNQLCDYSSNCNFWSSSAYDYDSGYNSGYGYYYENSNSYEYEEIGAFVFILLWLLCVVTARRNRIRRAQMMSNSTVTDQQTVIAVTQQQYQPMPGQPGQPGLYQPMPGQYQPMQGQYAPQMNQADPYA